MPARDERLLAALRVVAPGTGLREGIDRIIRSSKGAIIVIGETPALDGIVSGGFRMAAGFTAQRLSEVAKMDGAIVVDAAVDRIVYANVHLVPDPAISTNETGTRHRTAERTARQTGLPVVSVSESMRTVSLYLDSIKHQLDDSAAIMYRANQALATLERYRIRLDELSTTLSSLEVQNAVTLRDALAVVQRALMVERIAEEIRALVVELGADGRLLGLQLEELVAGARAGLLLVVRDYLPARRRRLDPVLTELDALEAEQLLDLRALTAALGHDPDQTDADQQVVPRGYRLLSRVPRLPEPVAAKLVSRFSTLPRLLEADLAELDAVEGVGEARARSVRDGLRRAAEWAAGGRYA